jgi:hypothetical protein
MKTKRWVLWVAKLFVLVVYLVLIAYSVIVGIAFVLQLLGANPTASFADWVYRAANNITEPFRGIFPTTQVSDRSEFNASWLFALIVYLILAVALHALIDWLARQIAGVDRAEAWAQQRAALEAQQASASAALGIPQPGVAPVPGDVPPAAVYAPATPGTPSAPAWGQPAPEAVPPVPPAPTAGESPPPGAWRPGMPVEPPEPMLPSD